MDSVVLTTVNHKAESKQEEVKGNRLPKTHSLQRGFISAVSRTYKMPTSARTEQ